MRYSLYTKADLMRLRPDLFQALKQSDAPQIYVAFTANKTDGFAPTARVRIVRRVVGLF